MTEDTGHAFAGVENILWETCLPCLFFGKLISLPPIAGTLSTMLVNKTGIGIQYPVTSANNKYPIFLRASCELIKAVIVEREFYTADHLLDLR